MVKTQKYGVISRQIRDGPWIQGLEDSPVVCTCLLLPPPLLLPPARALPRLVHGALRRLALLRHHGLGLGRLGRLGLGRRLRLLDDLLAGGGRAALLGLGLVRLLLLLVLLLIFALRGRALGRLPGRGG